MNIPQGKIAIKASHQWRPELSVAAMMLALAGSYYMSARTRPDHQGSDVLRVRRIEVIDENGTVLGYFGAKKDASGVVGWEIGLPDQSASAKLELVSVDGVGAGVLEMEGTASMSESWSVTRLLLNSPSTGLQALWDDKAQATLFASQEKAEMRLSLGDYGVNPPPGELDDRPSGELMIQLLGDTPRIVGRSGENNPVIALPR